MRTIETSILAALLLCRAAPAPAGQSQIDNAVALYKAGKLAEAQQAFENIAAADPQNADAQYHLGLVALRRDDYQKAVDYLEKVVSLSPGTASYFDTLAEAYGLAAQRAGLFSRAGFARKCKAAYERAVELEPNNVGYRWSLMEYYRQAPGFVGGGKDKALAQAGEIRKLDDWQGRRAYAEFYANEKQYDRAFAEFAGVLESKPDDYAALLEIGRLAASTGQQLDYGQTSLKKCLNLKPPEKQASHATVRWLLGRVLEKKGDTAGARSAYEAALKLDPRFLPAAEALKKLK